MLCFVFLCLQTLCEELSPFCSAADNTTLSFERHSVIDKRDKRIDWTFVSLLSSWTLKAFYLKPAMSAAHVL